MAKLYVQLEHKFILFIGGKLGTKVLDDLEHGQITSK
jgi:hypothetical protein